MKKCGLKLQVVSDLLEHYKPLLPPFIILILNVVFALKSLS